MNIYTITSTELSDDEETMAFSKSYSSLDDAMHACQMDLLDCLENLEDDDHNVVGPLNFKILTDGNDNNIAKRHRATAKDLYLYEITECKLVEISPAVVLRSLIAFEHCHSFDPNIMDLDVKSVCGEACLQLIQEAVMLRENLKDVNSDVSAMILYAVNIQCMTILHG